MTVKSIYFAFAVFFLLKAAGAWGSPPFQESPGENRVGQILSLLERGERAQAESFIREYAEPLTADLSKLLEDIDRDFDEMGRQKARSDILAKKFDQLKVDLARYETIFQLHAELTGQQTSLKRFQAKKLRIEGAEHTTRADELWDRQEYDEAITEYSEAISKLQHAIPLARLVEDQKLIASCVNNIGYAEIFLGNEAEGLRNYSEALRIAERRQDDLYRGLYALNMGTFYLYTGKPEVSLRYSQLATELNRKSGRKTWEANTLLNLGSAYLSLGRNEEARRHLQMAFQKAQEAKDRRSHGRVLYNLALVAASLDQQDEAARQMEQALQWYRENEEVYSRAEQTVLQYQGMNFLVAVYRKLDNLEKVNLYVNQITELRNQDPQKLAAYLADPHLNFYKWREFKKK
ncbi:MAG: tetratricopeptide repeat protein [Acidobacteria bacterium]|nr:tetratricopeptide repeat protein [Acidobacteriota bacterium]